MDVVFPRSYFPLPRRAGERLWYHLGRFTANGLAQALFRLDLAGIEAIPAGAKILACNHPTTIDPVMMTTFVTDQVSILISETLFKVPLLGPSLRWGGHIRVVHAQGKGAFEEGLAHLREGRAVGIFPEGALSPGEGRLARLHSGAVRLAMLSGAPIVPLGVAVDWEKVIRLRLMVNGQVETPALYLRGGYAVSAGEPFWPQGSVDDGARVREETDDLGRRITALSAVSATRLHQSRIEGKWSAIGKQEARYVDPH